MKSNAANLSVRFELRVGVAMGLCILTNAAMGAVTPYSWIRAGETGNVFLDSSGNNKNFNAAFSSGCVPGAGGGGNPAAVIVPTGVGGPLGTVGAVSTSAALLDHPERVLSPLLRRDGRLVEVSWETALDFVAERLLEIKAKYGASALGAFGSGALTNEKTYLLGKFARVALGTPNIDYNGRYCMSSAAAGQNRAFGVERYRARVRNARDEPADCVFPVEVQRWFVISGSSH